MTETRMTPMRLAEMRAQLADGWGNGDWARELLVELDAVTSERDELRGWVERLQRTGIDADAVL